MARFLWVALPLVVACATHTDEVERKVMNPVERLKLEIVSREDLTAGGFVELIEEEAGLRVKGELTGLRPGAHALRFHREPNCEFPRFEKAGETYRGSEDKPMPFGYQLTLVANSRGTARFNSFFDDLRLDNGEPTVLGRSLIIHKWQDDRAPRPQGYDTSRVACAEIMSTSNEEGLTYLTDF